MSETIGTTELTDGLDAYKYGRFDFHIDRYLGGFVTKEVAIRAYQEDMSYYDLQDNQKKVL